MRARWPGPQPWYCRDRRWPRRLGAGATSGAWPLPSGQVDFTHIIRFTGPSNLTGLPALSVPCGFKGNLPIGLQIIGPAFKEGRILNVGYAIEQTNPLKNRKPNIFSTI